MGQLAGQEDQSQQVAEDDAFLLLERLAGDVLVEVAAELKHFAGRPNRLRADVVHAGKIVVELQAQLLGQRQHPGPLLVENASAAGGFVPRRRDELVGGHQPQAQ